MKRRKFFKRIGIASLGVMVAPIVAAEVIKEPPLGFVFEGENVVSCIKHGRTISLNNPENIMKLWRETGVLVLKPYSPIYHKTNPVTRTKEEIERLFMPII